MDLWERKQAGDAAARDRLIRDHEYLARVTATRFFPHGHRLHEDATSWATVGLINAVDLFDPGRGVQFKTYALHLVRGAVLEFMRRDDWLPQLARRRVRSGEEQPIQVLSLEAVLYDEEDGAPQMEFLADPAPGPEEALLRGVVADELWELLDIVTPDQAAAIYGRWRGKAPAELAAELGITLSAVHHRITDGRKRLRAAGRRAAR